MDDQNKKNPYDDFFRGEEGDRRQRTEKPESEQSAESEQAEKPSYYYSYGPFKSAAYDNGQPQERSEASEEQRRDSGHGIREVVEVTPPKPVPQYNQGAPAGTKSGWQLKEKRRSSWKPMFASFMTGVILLGGLMVTADYQNWFTADQAIVAQSGESGSGSLANSQGGSTVSNAMDIVRPNNIAKVFEQSSPAVVKIETYVQSRSSSGGTLFEDPFFRQFFGDNFTAPTQPETNNGSQFVPSGLGSGFFFDETGYILTNQHVIGNSEQIKVTVQGYDQPLEAKLLGSSYELDLAVLKVEGDKAFPTLKLGDSSAINIGDWVVAIGNPNGFDHTVTVGVLSAKERPITIPDTEGTRNYEHLLQTDASINPGNSGGPLINLNGEVIGINTAVSTQAQGIGFAIPTSTILEVLDNLKNNKEIPKEPVPFIGATLGDMNEQIAAELGLETTKGSIVSNITYKSPAYIADLRQYDVITGMDGKDYDTKEGLIAAIKKKNVGDSVTLHVIRNGQKIDLDVVIGNKNDFNVSG
ncbi:S1C family serine protease [Paenibacillus tarimensis]|uniref:S1C family serine protease n=1 Tax=Paenibacillus tarimensis TaxID=416012 RepID=UPI001F308DB6|nr:trypsin-like peptidase domain-containing protein [Paenibacillus tarimensis]MCF2943819.1 trypsin-like peptidase domain-containing protein [Paenibacillus tarimensis]